MQCFLFISLRPIEFSIRIKVLVGLFLGLQIVTVVITGGAMTSAVLHLLGAAAGFPLAIVMLKTGMVDCEHWDLFSVIAGLHQMSPEEREQKQRANDPNLARKEAASRDRRQNEALESLRQIMAGGEPSVALKFHQRIGREQPGWRLPEPDLLRLVQTLHEKNLFQESLPLMGEYLSQYPEKSEPMRLKLAYILLAKENRPAQALKVLAKVRDGELDAHQKQLLAKLRAKAEQLHQADPYELADADW